MTYDTTSVEQYTTSNEAFNRARKALDDHLDICGQCANNPFAMCPIGWVRLHNAALAAGYHPAIVGVDVAVDRSRSTPDVDSHV
jgi:hypothetical protein